MFSNFNHQSTSVVVSSDHGTIHVFNLEEPNRGRDGGSSGGGGGGSSLLTRYFTSQWSFCKFSIPQGPPCICAFGSENNSVIGECCAPGSLWLYCCPFPFHYVVHFSDMCGRTLLQVCVQQQGRMLAGSLYPVSRNVRRPDVKPCGELNRRIDWLPGSLKNIG